MDNTSFSLPQTYTNIPACKIPDIPNFPKFFKSRSNWITPKLPNCNYEAALSHVEGQELVINPNFTHLNCCMTNIRRRDQNDSLFDLSPCIPVKGRTTVSSRESVLVQCGNFINLETFIPMKDQVKKKIQFWQKISPDLRPISVLLLGIDSVSRAHAYRSLPKTMEYMKIHGFIDFNHYHSIAPSTFTNFLGFLSGMTRNHVRSTCAPDWISPVDKCPLIWADFNQEQYVTSYTEDWGQTFSWGGQAGFQEEPTDYYVHTPFIALRTIRNARKNYVKSLSKEETLYRDLNLDCASNSSVPQHILDYFLRFSKKFEEIPYFTFTWINNPFHEENNALPHFDHIFLQFFETLLSNPAVKKRLLIIFLSDHGARTSFFLSRSVQSFVERGLPALMIHAPEALKYNHPEMAAALRHNRHSLITPFDIHHSLLHIVSLAQRNKPNFKTTLPDRSTVFKSIDLARTCETVHIPRTFCLCNIKIDDLNDTEVSLQVITKMLNSTVDYLNDRIQSSGGKYKDLCETWKARVSGLLYTKLIASSPNHVEYILAFASTHWKARFEARIYVSVNPKYYLPKLLLTNNVRNITVLGISRISKYGDQSLCVKAITDADKELKELCWCKDV
ncbi:unnamed protein product [Allacma fusca]|uniref:Uncharacterized protein n=1 Tax=Allacma fusca TaxID=39272 RepID=A0A8J2K8K0_9HEXA|nr:unnamed protein product [Allacma fusca]